MRDDDSAEILLRLDQAQTTNDILLAAVLDVPTARVGVVLGQRFEHLMQRQAIANQLLGVHQDLVLLHQSAEAVDVGHARHPAQDWPHDPILKGAQLHGVPPGALERVLVDLAEPSRDGSHLDVHARRQLFACLLESFKDQLAREVVVYVVLEHHGRDRKAELRERPDLGESRQTAHAHLDGVSHELLHLDRRHARGLGEDLDLNIRDIGKRVDRDLTDGVDAEADQRQTSENDEQALPKGEGDEAIHAVTPRSAGSWQPVT